MLINILTLDTGLEFSYSVLWNCRMIQQAFVDMENMYDLLNEKQEASSFYHCTDIC